MKQLVNGRIPANTICPFRKECSVAAQGTCHHLGEQHKVAFSCGMARAFELVKRVDTVAS